MRIISEILKEADKATELNNLICLWNEIAINKCEYPLVQLWFASEHIEQLVSKVNGSKRDKDLFYETLGYAK